MTEFDNSNHKLSPDFDMDKTNYTDASKLLEIYEEHKPTSELIRLMFERYGPKGAEVLKQLYNLEDDRNK